MKIYPVDEFRKWYQISKKHINFLPPCRPSASDLRCFSNIIRANSNETPLNAMILGATPELRDLLHELGASVTIVDLSPEMVREMNKLRAYTNPENIIIGDWFDVLPRNKRTFDIILSDLTQGNVPFSQHADFYGLISDALTANGIFIDRLFVFRDRSQLFRADEELKHYSEMSVMNLSVLNEIFFKLCVASDLVFEQGMSDLHTFYSLLENHYNNPILRKCAELMEEYLAPDGAIWYFGKFWDEISPVYFQKLNLISESTDTESFYKGIPCILASKPK